MFIKEIKKRNQGSDKIFIYHRLMESVRTPRGPRQRTILNLGQLELPRDEWKDLANRIEDIYMGQQSLFVSTPHIEELAQHYAQQLKRKEMHSVPVEQEVPDWERVDMNSLSQGESRSIGGEAISYNAFKKLGFPEILSDLGFSQWQIQQAALLIIGRLIHPASERETVMWAKLISALDELLGADFQHLSNNALYRLSDLLVRHRDEIERRLGERERTLFSLGEKIILYDLTNTYLEGNARESIKARHGRSKEKRRDCPLLTLALVLDEDGFPKASRIFPGNVSEPKTLKEMLLTLKRETGRLFNTSPTVVMDAGIATQENLDLIREQGYHYICVSRSRPREVPSNGLVVIKDDGVSVRAKKLDHGDEVLLYCESSGRVKKEEAMKNRFQKRFEEGLGAIADSLNKKRGIKRYEKVIERLGRLRERYPSIARFYHIDLQHKEGIVQKITWSIDEKEKLRTRFSGSYYVRSTRLDLDEKELWSLYIMLTQVEDAFRSLKSELGLRPIFHRKDHRMEGHLFITVLAYHLLASIQRELKKKGLSYRWNTIRIQLATQTRVRASITNDKGERIHIRQTTDPEIFSSADLPCLGHST